MKQEAYNFGDTIIKAIGIFVTAATILIGISQVNGQQRESLELEIKRAFIQKQNDIYTNLSSNAGAMAASTDDEIAFKASKQRFLSIYYGELMLVEDTTVERFGRELTDFLYTFNRSNNNMVNTLKTKVMNLGAACKQSSATYKAELELQ